MNTQYKAEMEILEMVKVGVIIHKELLEDEYTLLEEEDLAYQEDNFIYEIMYEFSNIENPEYYEDEFKEILVTATPYVMKGLWEDYYSEVFPEMKNDFEQAYNRKVAGE